MIYEFIPQFSKMLNNLSEILKKMEGYADHKKFAVSNLLNTRLVPDQFDFTWQVQATCEMATNFGAKLTGKTPPTQSEKDTTVAQLQERIQKTIQFLSTIKPEDFKGWETKQITNPRREGKFLPGSEFAMQQVIPNFYFHMTTAYAILRDAGLDIGKKDYLGELKYRDLPK